MEQQSLVDIQIEGELGEFIKVMQVLQDFPEIQSINIFQGSLKGFSDTKRFVYLSDGVTERKYVIAEIRLFSNKLVSVIEVEREDRALSMLICFVKQNEKVAIYEDIFKGLINRSGSWDKKRLGNAHVGFMTLKHGKNNFEHRARLIKLKVLF